MNRRVVIIGGGISGLAAAFKLVERRREEKTPLEITVLEARPQFGGVIESETRDGVLLEGGPDSFLSEKPYALDLCRRLGIDQEIIATQKEHRQSFLFQNGKLIPVPKGFYLIVPPSLKALFQTPLISAAGKIRAACEPFIPPRKNFKDESVASFIRRRFGAEWLERIGQPMLGGIYTADPEKLSLHAAFPRFYDWEQKYGSLIKAVMARKPATDSTAGDEAISEASGPRYSLFVSLRNGIGQLVEVLQQKIKDKVELRHSCKVTRIEKKENWRIHLENGESFSADAICLALPSYQSAQLARTFAGKLAEDLASIPYESVATVNLAFQKKNISHSLNGFGFVIPAAEKRKIIACTFASVKFPDRSPKGSVLFRAFVGGALQREMFELNDQEMGRVVTEEVKNILGIRSEPDFITIRRYPKSMPQYHVGHLEKVEAIEKGIKNFPGLYLCGNAYRGVGIPDCIHSAEQAAEEIFQFILRATVGSREEKSIVLDKLEQ